MLNTNIKLKIEIKNKPLFIKSSLAAVILLALILVSAGQLKTRNNLTQDYKNKSAELKDTRTTNKRLQKLETQVQALAEKEKKILTQAPIDEIHPFGLIKTITGLANEIGLKDTAFTIKEKDLPETSLNEQAGMTEFQGEYASLASRAGINPITIEMRFNGTYSGLIIFLKRLPHLERVVSVTQIHIERKKDIIPYQAISLQLTAYSFPKE